MSTAPVIVIALSFCLIAAKSSSPRVDGVVIDMTPPATAAAVPADYAKMVTDVAASGAKILMVRATMKKTGACAGGGRYDWIGTLPEELVTVLATAKTAHLDVYIGLVDTIGICAHKGQPFAGKDNAVATAFMAQKLVRALEAMVELGGAGATVKGWLITDPGPAAADIDSVAYYTGMAAAIRAVTLRPILAMFVRADGAGNGATKAIEAAASRYRTAGIDIQLWVDADVSAADNRWRHDWQFATPVVSQADGTRRLWLIKGVPAGVASAAPPT
jgi:hypothetical protein